jgi:hypothetical protein
MIDHVSILRVRVANSESEVDSCQTQHNTNATQGRRLMQHFHFANVLQNIHAYYTVQYTPLIKKIGRNPPWCASASLSGGFAWWLLEIGVQFSPTVLCI